MPDLLAGLAGLLLDVDGTLLADDRPIAGAARAIAALRRRGLGLRAVTNTSRRSRHAVALILNRAGLDLGPAEVLTPAVLARRLILASGRPRAALLVPEEARRDFEGIEDERISPDWVVLGDLGDGFTPAALADALRMLRRGARLVALHRNRSWRPPGSGEVLDVGAYAAALEFAAGVWGTSVGKPEPAFVRLALEELGVAPERAALVGDDPESDVLGAKAAGCRAILVRTGKFTGRAGDQEARGAAVVESVADLA